MRSASTQWEKGSGSLIQPLCMVADRGDDPFRLGENLLISESENGPAESLQLHLSEMISQYHIIPVVASTRPGLRRAGREAGVFAPGVAVRLQGHFVEV